MMHHQRAPRALTQQVTGTILLRLGERDDSVYYQAPIVSTSTSLTVSLHQTSLLLERLRLHSALTVSAQHEDGTVYGAELTLVDGVHGLAQLVLGDITDHFISEPRFIPIT